EHNPAESQVGNARGEPSRDGRRKAYPTLELALGVIGKAMQAVRTKSWFYSEQFGKPIMVVARFDLPDGGKAYRPFSRIPAGWRVGDPPGWLPLYNLKDLSGATRVYVVEGEKSAELIRGLGLVATTSAHGAQSPERTQWQPLAGKELVLIPDHDKAGE